MAFNGFTISNFDHPCCVLVNHQIWTRIHEEKKSLQSAVASCCLQFWCNGIKCLDGRRSKFTLHLKFEGFVHNGPLLDFQLLTCGLKCNYNFICQLVDRSDNEYEVRVSTVQGHQLFEFRLIILLLSINRLPVLFGGTTFLSSLNLWILFSSF